MLTSSAVSSFELNVQLDAQVLILSYLITSRSVMQVSKKPSKVENKKKIKFNIADVHVNNRRAPTRGWGEVHGGT